MIKDVIKTIDQIATEDPQRIAYDYLGETNTRSEEHTSELQSR